MINRDFSLAPYVVRISCLSRDHTIIVAYDPACTKARPGNGATRWMQYESVEAAEREARALAERMAVKHDIYKTGFLGAKVIVCGPRHDNTDTHVLTALADLLNQMDGLIYTGCGLNMHSADMEYLSRLTPFIMHSLSNPNIDTARAAESGVFAAARTTIDNPFHKETPKLAIHGLGKVGSQVALDARKAGYTVACYTPEPVQSIPEGIQSVSEDELLSTSSDVFVLCSPTGVLTDAMADSIQSRWVVPASNMAIQDSRVLEVLDSRGISYLPDPVANSGAALCDSLEWKAPELYRSLSQEQANRYVRRRVAARTSEAISLAELNIETQASLTKALQVTW